MQVLDDGRLTDSKGRTVDFKNTIIIMTSNIGANYLVDSSISSTKQDELVLNALKEYFRPEFINRIDDIIIFNRLSKENIKEIALLAIKNIENRLKDKNIKLELNKEAISWIIDNGYDEVYGARPLKRLLKKELENKLALAILSGDVEDGQTMKIIVKDNMLQFC